MTEDVRDYFKAAFVIEVKEVYEDAYHNRKKLLPHIYKLFLIIKSHTTKEINNELTKSCNFIPPAYEKVLEEMDDFINKGE
ncbi:MAG: hypothetical protein GXN99_02605 [Candidatus Nanohaloarchaeota archaeon]|nr:hypothetical protein [Candidatus Nanohaloarchaeota archaeon]